MIENYPAPDIMSSPFDGDKPQNPIDWEMWLVKNDSKWDFSIPVNDSKNPVPITFKAGQIRSFPFHRAKWLSDQLAKRILVKQWQEEEKEVGAGKSTLLLNSAVIEEMEKRAKALLLGKEEDLVRPIEIETPIEAVEEPKKKGNPEALKKWREAQKLK